MITGVVAFGDAEIFSGAEEATEAVRVQREDGGAGGVVEGEHGIQLVLSHVADDNRHS